MKASFLFLVPCLIYSFLSISIRADDTFSSDLEKLKTVLGPEGDSMIKNISSQIASAQSQGRVQIIIFDPQKQEKGISFKMDDYQLDAAPNGSGAAVLVVGLDRNQYLLLGQNIRVNIDGNQQVPFHHFTSDAMRYVDGELVRGIRYNGDERNSGDLGKLSMRKLCIY